MEDLRQKIVLVTGAARGMGRLHAANFAREGSVVVMTDVDEAELSKAADELRSGSYEVHSYPLDVSDRAACFALAEKVKADVGVVDVLVNNAAVTECVPMLDLSEQSLRRMTDVNYLGQVWMMQAFLPGMVARGSGHVVNICSVAGKTGTTMLSGYCATKFALIGITDSVRLELHGSGVDFTIVNPGFVSTGMFGGARVPFVTRWQKPGKVSREVVEAVKKNRAEICVPRFSVRQVAFLRGLCAPRLVGFVFRLFRLDRSMDNWQKDACRPF